MVEKADPGTIVIPARPIEVDLDRDVGFRRLAADGFFAQGISFRLLGRL
jgi:hypothetical protein